MAIYCMDFELFPPLHSAAGRNLFKKVKKLLLKNIDVDAKAYNNSTALHVGSQYGHLKVVKLLIENKANVNAKNGDGFTPLHLAIQQSHLEVSEFLIENGANINSADHQNWIPLHNAANNGFSLKIVEDLITKGTDINARIDNGRTAIHLAAENNHLETVNFLIENGADVNVIDDRRWTPLHSAAYNGNLDVARSLLDKVVDINAKTVKSTTPLHFAVDHDFLEVVELLLERGADVNALDHTNWTALHFAADKGYDHIATVLLKYGADVSVKENVSRGTALHSAAQYGYPEVVKTLILNGADVNAKMDKNATPLHLGAQIGNLYIVKYLLMNGAYFDARADGGKYILPLHFAERRGISAVITLLKLVEALFKAVQDNNYLEVEKCIKECAIIDSQNTKGKTPLHYAVNNGHIDIVSILLTNGADATKVTNEGNTPLHTAVSKGYAEIVEILIQHVSRDKLSDFINAQTRVGGNTSLHIAANNDFFEIVKSLLMNGAYFDAKADAGKYVLPLHFAEKRGISAVAKLLKLVENLFKAVQDNNYLEVENCIREDVIVNSKNTEGRTPLHYAVNNGHIGVVIILLINGADATKVTNKGNTPLHTAVSKGYAEIVAILLQHVSCDKFNDFINAQTTVGGTTALHVATKNGFFEIVKSLLMHGATYNIKNKDGKTPLHLSQNKNVTNLLKLMKELFEDAKNDDLEITANILERVRLLNKLSKLQVCLESDIYNQDVKEAKSILLSDFIYNITEYLSHGDLINLTLAFYDSDKH